MKIIEEYSKHETGQTISILTAKYIGDFAIRLGFNDGHQILVDFKPFLEKSKHPTISKYLNETKFKEFRIVNGNLDWNDFELCFPIEDLYNNAILKKTTYNIV